MCVCMCVSMSVSVSVRACPCEKMSMCCVCMCEAFHTATHGNTHMWHEPSHCNSKKGSHADESFIIMRSFTLQHTATHICDISYVTVKEGVILISHSSACVLSHCNTLWHTATHCNTLQHTTTHCNTWQYSYVIFHRWRLFYCFICNVTYAYCLVLQCERPHDYEWLISGTPSFTVSYEMPHICIALCCSVLQCFAVCCSVKGLMMINGSSAAWLPLLLLHVKWFMSHMGIAMCCSVLQCVAVCCNVLQCEMTHDHEWLVNVTPSLTYIYTHTHT